MDSQPLSADEFVEQLKKEIAVFPSCASITRS